VGYLNGGQGVMGKQVLELIRVTNMGQGSGELLAQELSKENSFEPIGYWGIRELFLSCGIPLEPLKNQEYFVYYAYHSSSGYKTVLYVNDEGVTSFKVERPKGGVLCAFWSEIIVFSMTDKWH
jgi:hypothetical protein